MRKLVLTLSVSLLLVLTFRLKEKGERSPAALFNKTKGFSCIEILKALTSEAKPKLVQDLESSLIESQSYFYNFTKGYILSDYRKMSKRQRKLYRKTLRQVDTNVPEQGDASFNAREEIIGIRENYIGSEMGAILLIHELDHFKRSIGAGGRFRKLHNIIDYIFTKDQVGIDESLAYQAEYDFLKKAVPRERLLKFKKIVKR